MNVAVTSWCIVIDKETWFFTWELIHILRRTENLTPISFRELKAASDIARLAGVNGVTESWYA
jgi:hypothetical protein